MFYISCELKLSRDTETKKYGARKLLREANMDIPMHSFEVSEEVFNIFLSTLQELLRAVEAVPTKPETDDSSK